ncbi:hypothetical protein [Absidia glauca]|uniref:Ndc10 domain-containing protein n=1 Tax=Absidia glauca TaxID=4829 RepID=A0A168PGV9_ABSGL|nr:hypothetical protein [Absidia glauca]
MLNFAENKGCYGGGLSESLTQVPGIAGTQFEMKIKPPRQAQEWSYSSHRESIARMADNVCANVDQIRRQGRGNNTTINGAYLTNLPRKLVQSMAGFPTYGRFFYLARAALNPPTCFFKKLSQAIGE